MIEAVMRIQKGYRKIIAKRQERKSAMIKTKATMSI